MKTEMVRYNGLDKDAKNRKDVLHTFRDGDLVFFGIARCNFKSGDKFDREKGRVIAKGRAEKAHKLFQEQDPTILVVGDLYKFNEDFTDSFLPYGAVRLENIKELLNYFRSLTTSFHE